MTQVDGAIIIPCRFVTMEYLSPDTLVHLVTAYHAATKSPAIRHDSTHGRQSPDWNRKEDNQEIN